MTVGPLPTIRGDSARIYQLFLNLVGNGIKFHRPEEPPRVEVSARNEGAETVFRVADNGIGIAPEHRELIFQRTDAMGRTGLYRISLDGSEPRQMSIPQDGSDPSWSGLLD